jgi:threonylcarbamoyladenosine tRNA methylthiotransferase CDKAL1
MKREYNVLEFEEIVNYLREKVPGITIATDIICGFPTETEEDFEMTMKLCEQYKFPSLFINQFFPRPGTPAAQMKRIPADQVKTRTKRLTDLFYTYEPYGHKLDEIQEVLVTEISKDKKHYVGHNKFYEQVLIPMRENLLGKSLKVQIIGATKFSMIARIVDHEDEWKKVNMNIKEDLIKNENIGNGFVHDSNYVDTNGETSNDLDYKDEENNDKWYLIGLVLLFFTVLYKFIWNLYRA